MQTKQAKLVDGLFGSEYQLSGNVVLSIGRGPGNDISLPEYHEDYEKLFAIRRVSPNQAKIECKDGKYFIVDNSTNGTCVNGSLVKVSEIKNGDKLQLPFYPLKVVIE